MRITWLAVNASHSHTSLALPLLHAASQERLPATWSVVRATVNDRVSGLLAQVWAQQPDVLAASVYLFNRELVMAVCRRVKALLPGCRVLLGGPEFLGDNAEFLRHEPAVTAVLRGEGEASFGVWLAAGTDASAWEAIPGLCWRDRAGVYHDQGLAVVGPDLDVLPPPTASPFFDSAKPFVLLETSRGCLGACAYCTSSRTGPLRHYSFERVSLILHELCHRGVREVRVLDRTFNQDPARCCALLDLFRLEAPDLRFHLEIHPGLLPSQVRAALHAFPPGRLHLEVGLQSGTVPALEAVGRRGHAEEAWNGTAFLCACPGLEVHVDLLAGLPEQSLAQVVADLERLIRQGPTEVQLELLKVLPGTPLAAAAGQLGIVYAPVPPYEVLRTPQLPPDQVELARLLSRLLDGYHNPPALRSAFRAAVRAGDGFVLRFLEFLRHATSLDEPASLEARFRLFHRFAVAVDTSLRDRLEYEWLRQGFSPTHGIARAELWQGAIPAAARLIEGRAEAPGRKTRVWHLRQAQADAWFSFSRSGDRQASAVYLAARDGGVGAQSRA
jgi:hypothetical protein